MFPQIMKMPIDRIAPKINDRQIHFRIAAGPRKPPSAEKSLISPAPNIRKWNNQKSNRIGRTVPIRNDKIPLIPWPIPLVRKPASHRITIQPFAISPVFKSINTAPDAAVNTRHCCRSNLYHLLPFRWLWRHYIRRFFVCPAFSDNFLWFVNCWQTVWKKLIGFFLCMRERFWVFIVPVSFLQKNVNKFPTKVLVFFFPVSIVRTRILFRNNDRNRRMAAGIPLPVRKSIQKSQGIITHFLWKPQHISLKFLVIPHILTVYSK